MAEIRGVVHAGSGVDGSLVEHDWEAFDEAFGLHLYPGSLNVHVERPVAFRRYGRLSCSQGERMFVHARLEDLPVIISHRHPMKPPARRRLLVFAEVRLRERLGLVDGAPVCLAFDDEVLAPVPFRVSAELAIREVGRAGMDRMRRLRWHFFEATKRIRRKRVRR